MKNLLAYVFLFLSIPLTCFADSNKIIAISGSENADGATQNDFNIDMLNYLESHTKNKIKEKMDAYLKAQGIKNPKYQINSSAVYMNVQNMKLAVVRLSIEKTNQVHIFGIKGKELIRVACTSETQETIPISYGVCGDKINQAYGVKVSKGIN